MDKNKYAVIANNISKCYKMYSGPKEKLLDLLLPRGKGKEFKALKNISFKVEKGEIVGLLGLNGAGKSTLSNILGGVSIPSEGTIDINGESSVIAIGLGLNNFLTGIENIELKATMMGYKKEDIHRITEEVIEFAEIGDFINQPIRTYSSGMRSRLGFGIAVNMNPDILVIDEALSVGDPTFAQKCLDKMNEFKNSGKTIFFVSHSIPQIKEFCTKAMWLEYGTLKDYGDIDKILPEYQKYIKMINAMDEKEKKEYKAKALKEQEHSLLGDFKYKSFDCTKLYIYGKLLKKTTLTNDTERKTINYNLDILTAIFGFIPSVIRGNISDGMVILSAQLLNIFIMSMPAAIITNFIITAGFALFSGKRYAKNLILNRGYKPVDKIDIHEEVKEAILNGESLIIEKKEYKYRFKFNVKSRATNRKIKKKKNFVIGALISVVAGFVFSGVIYVMKNNVNDKKVEQNLVTTFNNLTKVTVEIGKDGQEKVDSIAVSKKNENNDIEVKIYPGDLLVKVDDKTEEISKLVLWNEFDSIKKLMKDKFNQDINDYIVVKESKEIEDSLDYYFKDLESISNNENFKGNIASTSMDENKLAYINKFYKDSGNTIVKYVDYKEKTLEELAKENNIRIDKDSEYSKYKIKYIDEDILNDQGVLEKLRALR